MSKPNEISIDDVKYIRQDSINKKAEAMDGMDYVLIRTYSAGVFTGYLKSRDGKEVVLLDAIRLWKWYGAASLSQLSMEGVKNPSNCKFGMPVREIILTEAIEIHIASEQAMISIKSVPSWKV